MQNTNLMSNLSQNANFIIECECTKLSTDELYADVIADRHRTRDEFKIRIKYGCLKHILSWLHSKILAIKGFTEKSRSF